jgi:enterochelin esterase-like enzyme
MMGKLPRRSCARVALGFCLLWGIWLGAFGAEPIAKVGTLAKITVHGTSLEGNLSGDSADRDVYVYLPAGYASSRKRRYPVVYFLHGFAATAERYVQFLALPASIDRAIEAGKLQDMIFVMPNAMTQYGGSMYSNSITTGDWERFVARDLVGYIDAHYRSIPRREARGLAGHSMGGYGTLRIGMKYSDTFGALYSMSGCCLDPRGAGPADAPLEKLATAEDVAKISVFGRTTLAASAAWAPDAARPPFFMDLPTQDGQPQADVLARYTANAPSVMVAQYAAQLKSYRAIMMDVGLQDGLMAGSAATDRALTRIGVPHSYVNYEGDHMNRIAARFEQLVIPFFSKELTAK